MLIKVDRFVRHGPFVPLPQTCFLKILRPVACWFRFRRGDCFGRIQPGPVRTEIAEIDRCISTEDAWWECGGTMFAVDVRW
jgi:hypothetical protein